MRTRLIGCVCGLVAGATFLAPLAASGELVVRPVLFAVEFCGLRRAGVPERQAIRQAVRAAATTGKTPGRVWAYGQEMTADTYLAVQAVEEACPEYLLR